MSGLLRSEEMAYVAITMPSDMARDTIRAIARLSAFHPVDLSPTLHFSAPGVRSTVTGAAVDNDTSASAESIAQRHCKYYKQRLASCVAWEKQLKKYLALRRDRFPSVPDLPCPAAGDSLHIEEIHSIDLLDALEAQFAPFERDFNFNDAFVREGVETVRRLVERRWVVQLMQGLDLNGEVARLHEQAATIAQSLQAPSITHAIPESPSASGTSYDFRNVRLSGIELGTIRRSPAPHPDATAFGRLHDRLNHIVCGVVPSSHQLSLTRLIYRVSRGNALIQFAEPPAEVIPVDDSAHRAAVEAASAAAAATVKSVFYIIYLGHHLEPRIRKIVSFEGGTLYDLPCAEELVAAAIAAEAARAGSDAASALQEVEPALSEEKKSPPASGDSSFLSVASAAQLYELEVSVLERSIADQTFLNVRTIAHMRAMMTKLFRDRDAHDREVSPLLNWLTALHQEKVVCATMQQAYLYHSLIAVEGWVPRASVLALQSSVKTASRGVGTPSLVEIDPDCSLRPVGTPPTAFPLNKFTHSFQQMVDTYGTPRYQEVNPGLFLIISFPFLFGIMYGDVGHGVIVTLTAMAMIAFEGPLRRQRARGQMHEIFTLIFAGRYLILLMGLFTVYVGAIYNDVFSISPHVFASGYQRAPGYRGTHDVLAQRPYPFGLDFDWQDRRNELVFYNSFKMKVAVIVGVTQMTFGIILSLVNHVHFGDTVSAWGEFLPRMAFMMAIFGYMCFLIVYKWCVDWSAPGSGPPPNLVQILIQMFLLPGSVDRPHTLYPHQGVVQSALIAAAAVSVPVMLCVKPCWLCCKRGRRNRGRKIDPPLGGLVDIQTPPNVATSKEEHHSDLATLNQRASLSSLEEEAKSLPQPHEEKVHALPPPTRATDVIDATPTSTLFLHQSIMTIEFILGAVSNTASYLRLWALSLAHQQLSQVFWNKMLMQYGIANKSTLVSLIGFFVWCVSTFAVLLCMDTLECFLHALRLHWVEWMNKFYYADGIPFQPITFNTKEEEHA